MFVDPFVFMDPFLLFFFWTYALAPFTSNKVLLHVTMKKCGRVPPNTEIELSSLVVDLLVYVCKTYGIE